MHHGELLGLGHRGEQFVGALGWWLGGVHPRVRGGLCLADADGQAAEDEQRGDTGAQHGTSGDAHVVSRGTVRAAPVGA